MRRPRLNSSRLHLHSLLARPQQQSSHNQGQRARASTQEVHSLAPL